MTRSHSAEPEGINPQARPAKGRTGPMVRPGHPSAAMIPAVPVGEPFAGMGGGQNRSGDGRPDRPSGNAVKQGDHATLLFRKEKRRTLAIPLAE